MSLRFRLVVVIALTGDSFHIKKPTVEHKIHHSRSSLRIICFQRFQRISTHCFCIVRIQTICLSIWDRFPSPQCVRSKTMPSPAMLRLGSMSGVQCFRSYVMVLDISGILVDFVSSLAIQNTEGYGYIVKIARAVQPMVSVATLFNTPLSYFSEDEQWPQALLYLNTCSITSIVTLNREETVAVGTHKAILTAQNSYIQALIKESGTVAVTGSAE